MLYALDPTGVSPNNKVVDEIKVVTPPAKVTDANFVVPNATPFFKERLVVKLGTRVLVEGVDYVLIFRHVGASTHFQREIFGGIMFYNKEFTGTVKITYQALGGDFQAPNPTIVENFTKSLGAVRWVTYDQILGLPSGFPPAYHMHDIETELVNMGDVVDVLERIATLIGSQSGNYNAISAAITDHVGSARAHTPAAVGLGNVKNYGVATATDVRNGTATKYVTADVLKAWVETNRVNVSGFITATDAARLYLTKTDATNTYATKQYADATFATKTSTSGFLTKAAADAAYATKTSTTGVMTTTTADTRYLSKTDATASYLSKTDATATYLSKTDATSTYASKTYADSTYATKTSLNSYLTTSNAASTYATKRELTNSNNSINAINTRINGLQFGVTALSITSPNSTTRTFSWTTNGATNTHTLDLSGFATTAQLDAVRNTLNSAGSNVSTLTSKLQTLEDTIKPTILTLTGNTTLSTDVQFKHNTYYRVNSTAAVTITLNPTVASSIRNVVHVRQVGTGKVTIKAGTGVTINPSNTIELRTAGITASLICTGTNSYDLITELP